MTSIGDLKELSELSDQSVLDYLQERYNAGTTYTHAGKNIIVSLNPEQILKSSHQFQNLSDQFKEEINAATLETAAELSFSGAFTALYEQAGGLKNQAFLITGESGSGKTENLKLLLKYFTFRRKDNCEENEMIHLYEKACDSNPILEAFGNASTCRNSNSSRFGKYVDLCYNENQRLISMNIRVFLLEKTRVLFLKDCSNESFHVFYQFQCAYNDGYFNNFPILSTFYSPFCGCASPPLNNETVVQHADGWSNLVSALNTFHFFEKHSEEELATIIASLLLLCQLKFQQSAESQCSDVLLSELDNEKFKAIECLLGLSSDGVNESRDYSELRSCLLQNRFSAGSTGGNNARRDTCYVRTCSSTECSNRRDALVKSVYQSLFNYLVETINSNSAGNVGSSINIGMLDIFGFEMLEVNRFEQLCINYTNERLQQHFLHHFVEETVEEYKMDGVHHSLDLSEMLSNSAPLLDNSQMIFLLTGPAGIFRTLDEECLLNRSKVVLNTESSRNVCNPGDINFLNRLQQNSQSRYLSVDSLNGELLIRHFASPVNYSAKQFVEKNMDRLPQDMEDFMSNCLYRDSSNSILTELKLTNLDSMSKGLSKLTDNNCGISREPLKDRANFSGSLLRNTTPLSTHTKAKKKNTIASLLKVSVDELLHELANYQVTYIRCIRPSNAQCDFFSKEYVSEQLATSGLKEAIKVLKMVHPARFPYIEFIRRYGFLINLCENFKRSRTGLFADDLDQLYLALDRRFRKLYGLTDTPKKATPKSLRRKSGGSCNEHSFYQTGAIISCCCHPWLPSFDDNLPYLTRLGKSRVYLNHLEYSRLEKLRRLFLNSRCRCIQRYWRMRRRNKWHAAASTIQKYYWEYRLRLLNANFVQKDSSALPFDSDDCPKIGQTVNNEDVSSTSVDLELPKSMFERDFFIYPDAISIRRRPSTKQFHWRKSNPLDHLIQRSNSLFKSPPDLKGLSDCLDVFN